MNIKKFLIQITILISLFVRPIGAKAANANQETFFSFLNKHYNYLDLQSFAQIQCNITSSNFKEIEEFLKIPALRAATELDFHPEDYLVLIQKGQGAKFHRAGFKLTAKPTVTDPAKLKSIATVNEQFESGYQGTINTIASLFIENFAPKADTLVVEKISSSGNDLVATIRDSSFHGEVKYSAATKHSDMTSLDGKWKRTTDVVFKRVGKLTLPTEIKMTESGGNSVRTTIESSISYQDVGGVLFIQKITSQVKAENGQKSRQSTQTIEIFSCKKS